MQDMKSVGMQHLEAVGRLKEEGRTFKRTIHLWCWHLFFIIMKKFFFFFLGSSDRL